MLYVRHHHDEGKTPTGVGLTGEELCDIFILMGLFRYIIILCLLSQNANLIHVFATEPSVFTGWSSFKCIASIEIIHASEIANVPEYIQLI